MPTTVDQVNRQLMQLLSDAPAVEHREILLLAIAKGEASMFVRSTLMMTLATVAVLIMPAAVSVRAQEKTETTAKAFRCTFPLIATGTWKKDGSADASVKAAKLVMRFQSINVDEGTAELMSGTVASGITVQSAGGNLHFVQAFRSGPLYVTTIFNKEIQPGKLKAVHSRHEYFSVPVEGSTSSPEQYYGECDVLN